MAVRRDRRRQRRGVEHAATGAASHVATQRLAAGGELLVQAEPVDEVVPVRPRRVVEVYDDPGIRRPWRPHYDVPIRVRPPYGPNGPRRPGGYWPGGRGPGLGQGIGRPGRLGPMPGGRYGFGMGRPMGGFAFRGGGFGLR